MRSTSAAPAAGPTQSRSPGTASPGDASSPGLVHVYSAPPTPLAIATPGPVVGGVLDKQDGDQRCRRRQCHGNHGAPADNPGAQIIQFRCKIRIKPRPTAKAPNGGTARVCHSKWLTPRDRQVLWFVILTQVSAGPPPGRRAAGREATGTRHRGRARHGGGTRRRDQGCRPSLPDFPAPGTRPARDRRACGAPARARAAAS